MSPMDRELLDRISDRTSRRLDVVSLYAAAIRADVGDGADWKAINRAIVARWSLSALNWIKREAWRAVAAG